MRARRNLAAVLFALACGTALATAGCGGLVATPTAPPSGTATNAEDTLPPGVSPPPTGLTPPSPGTSGIADLPVPSGPAQSLAPTTAPAEGSLLDRHSDPELEAALPGEVNGVTLARYSLTSAEFISPAGQSQFDDFVAGLGATAADVTMAAAIDPSGQIEGSIQALRVKGANPQVLLAAVIGIGDSAANPPTARQTTLAGHSVTVVTPPQGSPAPIRYYYGSSDVVFVVSTADVGLAEAFLRELA